MLTKTYSWVACFFLSSSSIIIIIRISGTWRLNITFRCFCWHITFRVSPFCRSFYSSFFTLTREPAETHYYIYIRVSPPSAKKPWTPFFFANYNKRWLSNFVKKNKWMLTRSWVTNWMCLHNCTKKKKRLGHTIKRKRKNNYTLLFFFFFCSYLIILSNKKGFSTGCHWCRWSWI